MKRETEGKEVSEGKEAKRKDKKMSSSYLTSQLQSCIMNEGKQMPFSSIKKGKQRRERCFTKCHLCSIFV